MSMTKHSFDDVPNIRIDASDRTVQGTNPNGTPSPAPTIVKANNQGLVIGALLLALIATGASGFLYYTQQQSQAAIDSATARIMELENRLSATGEEMGNSTVALQVKVGELANRAEELWDQMDKLWASAWRRNQSEIGDLNKTVMTLKASSEKSTKTLQLETADNNTALGLVQEQLESQASLLKQLNAKFNDINNVDADFEQQLENLREKLIATALANNDLTNQIDDLRRRVAAAEKKANHVEKLLTGPTS